MPRHLFEEIRYMYYSSSSQGFGSYAFIRGSNEGLRVQMKAYNLKHLPEFHLILVLAVNIALNVLMEIT